MYFSVAIKNLPRFFHLILIGIIIFALLHIPQRMQAQEWRPVRGGILYGISGMALVEQKNNSLDFLIVHDNKKKDKGRVAIISIKDKQQPEYSPVKWQDNTELPVDLEGLTSVPGKRGVILGTDDENLGSSVYILGQE